MNCQCVVRRGGDGFLSCRLLRYAIRFAYRATRDDQQRQHSGEDMGGRTDPHAGKVARLPGGGDEGQRGHHLPELLLWFLSRGMDSR